MPSTKSTSKTAPPPPVKKLPVYEIRPIWEEAQIQAIMSRDKLNAMAWKPKADTVYLRMSKSAGTDYMGDAIEKNAKVYPIPLPDMGGPDTPGPRTNKLGAINRDYPGSEGYKRIVQKLKEHEGNTANCDPGTGVFELWLVPEELLAEEEASIKEAEKNPDYKKVKLPTLTDKEEKIARQVGVVDKSSRGFGKQGGPRIPDAPEVEEELVEA